MKQNIIIRLVAASLLLSTLFISSSCEPPLCAYCYDRNGILRAFDDRDIEICAEDRYELDEMVWLAEDMGYYCEYQ